MIDSSDGLGDVIGVATTASGRRAMKEAASFIVVDICKL